MVYIFSCLQNAAMFDRFVVRTDWIDLAWEQRFNMDFDPASADVYERCKLKLFTTLCLGFVNFEKEEDLKDMTAITIEHGNLNASLTS